MFLVLFVTDYRKENESKAHKLFATLEAAIAEAKKFTDPPAEFREEKDELNDDGTVSLEETRDTSDGSRFEWESSFVQDSLYTGSCIVSYEATTTYERGACSGMSWSPVVTVVKVPVEGN